MTATATSVVTTLLGTPVTTSASTLDDTPTPLVSTVDAAAKTTMAADYARTPLPFEANVGQTSSQALFLSRSAGSTLFLASDGAYFKIARPNDPATSDVVALRFVGAATPTVTGSDPLTSTSNYFAGSDPSQWHTGVPNYGAVNYAGLAPGVSAVFYGATAGQLEYDLRVQPGANPSAITLCWDGAQSLSIDDKGNLEIHHAGGTLVQNAPTFYQLTANGQRQLVTAAYAVLGKDTFGFRPGSYDHQRARCTSTRPLAIRPTSAAAGTIRATPSRLTVRGPPTSPAPRNRPTSRRASVSFRIP